MKLYSAADLTEILRDEYEPDLSQDVGRKSLAAVERFLDWLRRREDVEDVLTIDINPDDYEVLNLDELTDDDEAAEEEAEDE